MTKRSACNSLWSARTKRKPANYYFLWWCNDDPIMQVTILSTVPRCEWKSWISVQQFVVVQIRCADVKLLWESEREKTWFSWITHVFSDDWFNLLVCVDLFTHLTNIIFNKCFQEYSSLETQKLQEWEQLCNIHTIPHFWTGSIINIYRDLW